MSERHHTVLIIDDDAALLPTLARTLELAGYQVFTARELVAGTRLLEDHAIDAVLLDLRLPGVEGLDGLETVRRVRPETPVIMISAFGTLSDAVRAAQLGAYDFLEKPVDRDRLLLMVRNACAKSRLATERTALLESLREHPEDIPQLLDFFLNRRSQTLNCPVPLVQPVALDALARYEWPGNVRELDNCAGWLATFGGPEITPRDVEQRLGGEPVWSGPKIECPQDVLSACVSRCMYIDLGGTEAQVAVACSVL